MKQLRVGILLAFAGLCCIASFLPVIFLSSVGPGAFALSAAPLPQTRHVTCSSDDLRLHWCQVDTRDGVALVKQQGAADCVFNRTWGYARAGVWVDRGCRADFEIIDRHDAK